MAKESESQDDRVSPQKPPRRPLTIDLPAEDIGRKAAAEGAPAVETPKSDAAAERARAETLASNSTPKEDAAVRAGGGSPAGAEIPSAFATRKAGASAPQPPKWRPVDEPPARSYTPILIAVSAAAAIAAVAIVVLALNGYLGPADDAGITAEVAALRAEIATLQQAQPEQDMAPLRQQVSALEQSVSELAARPPSGGSDAALTEIQGRVAALEEAGPIGSTAAIEARLAELSEEIAALRSATPGDATSTDATLAPLRQQIDAISARIDGAPTEERIAAMEAKLDELSGQIGAASALAPAVAADALAAALDSGRPFSGELAALKSLGIGAEAIDGLTQQAGTGLPTLAELRSSFEAALESVELSAPIREEAGTIDRLFQSARSLVEVRPVHPTAGSDPAAVVARIRGAFEAGDLRTALAEWAMLPDTIKTPTAEWAKQAQSRLQADDLAATVRADALARLGAGQ